MKANKLSGMHFAGIYKLPLKVLSGLALDRSSLLTLTEHFSGRPAASFEHFTTRFREAMGKNEVGQGRKLDLYAWR